MLGRLVELGGSGLSVRRLGVNRAGEIRLTRFLRNDAVTVDEMIAEAAHRTAERCRGREALVLQDTTVIRSSGGGGDYLHTVLALDAQDGTILGLVNGQLLSRSEGRKQQRRGRPVEEKESFRWLEGADRAASVCAGASRVMVIADREGDIYEAFALRPEGVDLLVRAAQDRALVTGEADAEPVPDETPVPKALFAALDAQTPAGKLDFDLPAQPGRKRRKTQLELRFAQLYLAQPKRPFPAGLPQAIEVSVVDVREASAPASGEPAVHWRLLTTRPVGNVAEGWAVAELYRKRWAIEQLFRTLKTQGYDIEGLRIEDPVPRNKLVVAALIAAVAVQQLVHARDGGPGPLRPCTDVFPPEDLPLLEAHCAKLEGKTQRQKNPHPKGSLAYAAWVCARLGGWTGYYGKPGPLVMLRGWLDFHAGRRTLIALGYTHNV